MNKRLIMENSVRFGFSAPDLLVELTYSEAVNIIKSEEPTFNAKASKEELNKIRKKLAKKFHADLGHKDPEKMANINAAIDVLQKPETASRGGYEDHSGEYDSPFTSGFNKGDHGFHFGGSSVNFNTHPLGKEKAKKMYDLLVSWGCNNDVPMKFLWGKSIREKGEILEMFNSDNFEEQFYEWADGYLTIMFGRGLNPHPEYRKWGEPKKEPVKKNLKDEFRDGYSERNVIIFKKFYEHAKTIKAIMRKISGEGKFSSRDLNSFKAALSDIKNTLNKHKRQQKHNQFSGLIRVEKYGEGTLRGEAEYIGSLFSALQGGRFKEEWMNVTPVFMDATEGKIKEVVEELIFTSFVRAYNNMYLLLKGIIDKSTYDSYGLFNDRRKFRKGF